MFLLLRFVVDRESSDHRLHQGAINAQPRRAARHLLQDPLIFREIEPAYATAVIIGSTVFDPERWPC